MEEEGRLLLQMKKTVTGRPKGASSALYLTDTIPGFGNIFYHSPTQAVISLELADNLVHLALLLNIFTSA